jgi:hypothetical protein
MNLAPSARRRHTNRWPRSGETSSCSTPPAADREASPMMVMSHSFWHLNGRAVERRMRGPRNFTRQSGIYFLLFSSCSASNDGDCWHAHGVARAVDDLLSSLPSSYVALLGRWTAYGFSCMSVHTTDGRPEGFADAAGKHVRRWWPRVGPVWAATGARIEAHAFARIVR